MDLHCGIVEFFTRTWIEVEMESSSITAKMVTEAAKFVFFLLPRLGVAF